jgi:hypothetical protein
MSFMVLSKRERYIAMGCGAAGVLLLVWFILISPWIDARQDLAAQLDQARQQLLSDKALDASQAKLTEQWKEMQQKGLQTDETQAQILTLTALNQWAPAAGVDLEAVKPDLPKPQGDFMLIGFGLSGEGSTRSVSLLLWSLEHAAIPLRVNDVLLQPRPEGTDDLLFTIHVSTLCIMPPKAAGASAGAQGGQS